MYTLQRATSNFAKLFEPGYIGGLRIKNRLVMPPMGTKLAEPQGVSDDMIAYYAARAKGGVGLIIVESCSVDSKLSGRYRTLLTLEHRRYVRGHHRLVEAIHCYGARAFLQLFHPGRHVHPEWIDYRTPVAPSPVPYPGGKVVPRELTIEEIEELIEEFANAAVYARDAGYDGVDVHAANGHLIHQFMSPRMNKRTDMYGGSLENRMNFPTMIIKRIKQRAGADFPVSFKLTAMETLEGGYGLEDSKVFAQYAEAAGADAIQVGMGVHREEKDFIEMTARPQSFPAGWGVQFAKAIKPVVRVPVIGGGEVRDPEFAVKMMEDSNIDFLYIGRALIADPEWPKKAIENRPEDINRCVACAFCLSSYLKHQLHCLVNSAAGRERVFSQLTPAPIGKKVVIAGGGPAGMEAARVAASRGHKVVIYEKRAELGGGHMKMAAVPPYKEKMNCVREYLVRQIELLGVDVRVNTEVTAEVIRRENPDVLIVATGAKPMIIDVPGVRNKNVVTFEDILDEKVVIEGKNVAVIGGFSTGCEVADYLVERDNKVFIIDIATSRQRASGMTEINRQDLLVRLRSKPVTFHNECHVKKISERGITIVDKESREMHFDVGLVVLATGLIPIDALVHEARGIVEEIHVIGDASKPRDMAAAIYEGALVGRNI